MRSTWAPEYRSMLVRLRQAREEAGLTQAEAGRCFGRHQAFISKVESGERRIDPVELAHFATVYGKPVEWFLDLQPRLESARFKILNRAGLSESQAGPQPRLAGARLKPADRFTFMVRRKRRPDPLPGRGGQQTTGRPGLDRSR